MVTDFTFVKRYFNSLFDSFDHTSILMTNEKDEIKDCFLKNFERVVIADWNSTAELQSRFFTTISYFIIKYLNENKLWENGEQDVKVKSVRVAISKKTSNVMQYRLFFVTLQSVLNNVRH